MMYEKYLKYNSVLYIAASFAENTVKVLENFVFFSSDFAVLFFSFSNTVLWFITVNILWRLWFVLRDEHHVTSFSAKILATVCAFV